MPVVVSFDQPQGLAVVIDFTFVSWDKRFYKQISV